MQKADYWINQLSLLPHPEGGHYQEVYRSEGTIPADALPAKYGGARSFATSIYFMLQAGEVSHFHRIQSDELWYFHAGSALTVSVIYPDGKLEELQVGPNVEKGETLQAIVPAGTIFGSSVNTPDAYSLVGCMVAPGFDFADFELFTTSQLLAEYPQHEAVIRKLTKEVYG